MDSLRTPDARFDGLPDYPFESHYVAIDAGDDAGSQLRVHYIDERPGPADASGETVLLLHGEPTWSYLYRHIIPPLVAAGHRCVAPDLVGFGKSDKPTDRFAYTYQAHVDWLRETVIDRLDLRDVTMVGHDWGGLLGLRLLAEHPDRFRRVVAASTSLPTGDREPSGPLSIWLQLSQRANPFEAGAVVDRGTVTQLDPAVRAAYNAPFPDERYLQGARQFPLLIPLTPYDDATVPNREAWSVLRTLSIPFLYVHADSDWGVGEGRTTLRDGVPGAQEIVIDDAGHFLQEDRGPWLATVIGDFIHSTSAAEKAT
ncbi:haloalkane dehalogenase [Dactylosporangium sp. McL0621]|uniref:haloalkane dehalogenase n=1 Tax=Dactylosporangium sp. McL0621 TaxID=3415678 RepID=UPI003CE73E13